MANNWRYYQQTGQAGGTTTLQYVDSFNGDDANSGAYNAPKQTIQGALDVASGSFPIIVCAGYFNEGDFLNRRSGLTIITEGFVTFDGTGVANFNPANHAIGINELASANTGVNNNTQFDFGIAKVINYTTIVLTNSGSGGFNGRCKNIIFIGGTIDAPASAIGGSGNTRVLKSLTYSLLINTTVNYVQLAGNSSIFQNLTLVNSRLNITGTGTAIIDVINNILDGNSVLEVSVTTSKTIDYNAIIGTLTEKIRLDGIWYNNTESAQSATSFLANDLPSTTDPLFNLLNDKDYTLQVGSPLRTASSSGSYIGFADYAGVLGANSLEWTVTDIDNTTTSGEAYLTGAQPVGTMESNVVQLFDKKRVIKRIMMPDFIINPAIGETIGRLASFNTPYLISLEIQYGDNALSMNGTWLRVPIGTQPLYDSVNLVGNDDPLFDIDNSVAIACKFIKYKITLRSNETPI